MLETLICSKLNSLETRLVDLSFDIWIERFGIQTPAQLSVESNFMNYAKQRFCSTTHVYQIICNSLYWTVQFIWSLSYLKVLSNDYFWVNWSTIDSLNHLFNVPSVFCQKSSFGRFLIFWFHSFGDWYPLAFSFNWALY